MTTRQQDVLATGAVWVLAAYAVLLLFMLLSPSDAAPSWLVTATSQLATDLGVPLGLAAPERVEFILNVAAFIPVSLLGSLVRPSLDWGDWTAGGFVASFAVEVVQAMALDSRSATHSDVVANTLGALLGAVMAGLLVRPLRRA